MPEHLDGCMLELLDSGLQPYLLQTASNRFFHTSVKLSVFRIFKMTKALSFHSPRRSAMAQEGSPRNKIRMRTDESRPHSCQSDACLFAQCPECGRAVRDALGSKWTNWTPNEGKRK
jgi:hypothetical protein